MNGQIMKQARSLAYASLEELKSALQSYQTEQDLVVLRVGYVLCRRRRELAKCELIARKIRKLDAALRLRSAVVKVIECVFDDARKMWRITFWRNGVRRDYWRHQPHDRLRRLEEREQ